MTQFDLRARLEAVADDVRPGPARHDAIALESGQIRRRRRSRWVAGGAVAAVASVAVGIGIASSTGPDPVAPNDPAPVTDTDHLLGLRGVVITVPEDWPVAPRVDCLLPIDRVVAGPVTCTSDSGTADLTRSVVLAPEGSPDWADVNDIVGSRSGGAAAFNGMGAQVVPTTCTIYDPADSETADTECVGVALLAAEHVAVRVRGASSDEVTSILATLRALPADLAVVPSIDTDALLPVADVARLLQEAGLEAPADATGYVRAVALAPGVVVPEGTVVDLQTTPYRKGEPPGGVDDDLDGRWDAHIVGDDTPGLYVEFNGGGVTGSNGCVSFGGHYVRAGIDLVMDDILSRQPSCAGGPLVAVLSRVRHVTSGAENGVEVRYLHADNYEILVVLRR